jgi:ATP-dependent exoDNAse (exonuclease V) beta subunit
LIVPSSFSDKVLDAQEKGLMLHEILARITDKEIFTEVLEEEFNSRSVAVSTRQELKKTLDLIITHPQLKEYFEGNDKVFCEQEILIPNRPTLRPDRVNVSSDGSATILDYKTGSPKTEDQKQIESYEEALIQLGYLKVESKLVYINKKIDVISNRYST